MPKNTGRLGSRSRRPLGCSVLRLFHNLLISGTMCCTMSIASSLERCSDPVLLCDERGTVIWRNPAARRMLGLSADPVAPLAGIVGAQAAAALLKPQPFTSSSVETTGPAGALPQTVIALAVGSGEPGGELYLLVFKSWSMPLEQPAAREESLAMVAHDLKNPIGAIFGYADALLDTPIGDGMNKGQRNVIARIRSTAARSIEMVRNCELLFKLNAGALQRAVKPIDLNATTRDVLEYSWRDEPEAPRLYAELWQEPLPIAAERMQLDRIVGNLFSNALKSQQEA